MSSFCKSSVFTRQVLHHCSQSPLHSLSYLQTAPCPWVPVFSVTPVRGGRKPSTRCLCCQVKNWLKQAQPCKLQAPHLHCWLYFGHGQSVAQFPNSHLQARAAFYSSWPYWAQKPQLSWSSGWCCLLGPRCARIHMASVCPGSINPWFGVCRKDQSVHSHRCPVPAWVWCSWCTDASSGIRNVPLQNGASPVPPHEVPLWKRKPICANLSAAAAPVSPHLSLQTWDNTRT